MVSGLYLGLGLNCVRVWTVCLNMLDFGGWVLLGTVPGGIGVDCFFLVLTVCGTVVGPPPGAARARAVACRSVGLLVRSMVGSVWPEGVSRHVLLDPGAHGGREPVLWPHRGGR